MLSRIYIFRTAWLLIAAVLLSSCSPTPRAVIASPAEVKQQIEDSDASLILVHAWATWCHPCREEFPELMRVIQHYQSSDLEVLLVSADHPSELDVVRTFLAEHQSPVGSLVSAELGQGFIETLSSRWSGALPATFLYEDGRLLTEWEGKRSYEQYIEEIDRLLKQRKE